MKTVKETKKVSGEKAVAITFPENRSFPQDYPWSKAKTAKQRAAEDFQTWVSTKYDSFN